MAPSRGTAHAQVGSVNEDAAIQQQSKSAWLNAKRNLNYLISPSTHASDAPARLRTRALLRFVRSISQFVIWRLVRWAKYAAVAALVAAISASAFGGVITGAAWLAAPPTFGASIIAASIWGVGKFTAGRLNRRWRKTGGDVGEEMRERAADQGTVRSEGTYGTDMGPRAQPW
jgi:hypothetical protein